MSFAAMISPSEMTGRSTIRFTPTMATSGRLMKGVDIINPSGPMQVSVIVDQVGSAWVDVPTRVELERRALSAARWQRLRYCAGGLPTTNNRTYVGVGQRIWSGPRCVT